MSKLIFIDESGDVGSGVGSSKYFCISIILFESGVEAEKVSNIIKEIKIERFKNENTEFHFTKDSISTKKYFFEEISLHDFKIKSVLIKKSKNIKYDYKNILIESIKYFCKYLNDSKIFIDGVGGKKYKREINTLIQKTLKKEGAVIKNVKFVDSKKENLIQLADMCAGLIRRKNENKNKDIDQIFGKIKNKLEILEK